MGANVGDQPYDVKSSKKKNAVSTWRRKSPGNGVRTDGAVDRSKWGVKSKKGHTEWG